MPSFSGSPSFRSSSPPTAPRCSSSWSFPRSLSPTPSSSAYSPTPVSSAAFSTDGSSWRYFSSLSSSRSCSVVDLLLSLAAAIPIILVHAVFRSPEDPSAAGAAKNGKPSGELAPLSEKKDSDLESGGAQGSDRSS